MAPRGKEAMTFWGSDIEYKVNFYGLLWSKVKLSWLEVNYYKVKVVEYGCFGGSVTITVY